MIIHHQERREHRELIMCMFDMLLVWIDLDAYLNMSLLATVTLLTTDRLKGKLWDTLGAFRDI